MSTVREYVEGANYTQIKAELLDGNNSVISTQTFTPAMGNLVKSFTLNGKINTTSCKIRFTVSKTQMSYNRTYYDSRNSNEVSAANAQLLHAYNLKFAIPSYKFTTTGVIKINRGYANFIATDGSTNAYSIE